jgi:hypothetical protein
MEHSQIKVFVHKDTPRLRYTLNIILNSILGLDYEVIADKRKIGKSPAINYSDENINGCFKISPDTILFEPDIKERKIEVFKWKDLPVFFEASSDSDLPFDLFAASFYLVSRYEEYLGFQPDDHGRFKEENCIAYRNGFLQRPVIDLWAKELSLLLLKKFQTLTFKRNEFKALLTIDVDQAFAFRGKGFIRTVGGMMKDILTNSGTAAERFKCITGKLKDPYDVYDFITGEIDKNNSDTIFFFPVGAISDNDKNPDFRNSLYRDLIIKISQKFRTGLHPSYRSAERPSLFKNELKRLEEITGKEIDLSRQHFLKLRFPETYQNILKNNIQEDYSLGYVNEPGFRAGIARPFRFFDLKKNEETTLKLIPFQIMDGTLLHKSSDPQKAIKLAKEIISETQNVGGLFVSIWHNTSLTGKGEWKGWRLVFEFILNQQNV